MAEHPFRQAFHLWERTAAAYLEALAKNPLFLSGNSAALGGLLRIKKATDEQMDRVLGLFGLANRRSQEHTLHLLEKIDARLDDLELKLEQQRQADTRER